jgi:hypothetical protein
LRQLPFRWPSACPEQYLRATFQADRAGYHVAVGSVYGYPPPLHRLAWVAIAATSVNGSMAGPLAVTTDGAWAGTWSNDLGTAGRPLHVPGG